MAKTQRKVTRRKKIAVKSDPDNKNIKVEKYDEDSEEQVPPEVKVHVSALGRVQDVLETRKRKLSSYSSSKEV